MRNSAAVVIQEVLPQNMAPATPPPVVSAPPQAVDYELVAANPAPAQQVEPNHSAVSSFQTPAIQHNAAPEPTKSSFRLIGEVERESVAVTEVGQSPATPNWDITPVDSAPPAPAVEARAQEDHRVQSLISRMEEMRARGQNTAAPVTWQSKKSELFRLE